MSFFLALEYIIDATYFSEISRSAQCEIISTEIVKYKVIASCDFPHKRRTMHFQIKVVSSTLKDQVAILKMELLIKPDSITFVKRFNVY